MSDPALPDHVDVLVIGAGLSGIGAASRLTIERPDDSFVVLEARGSMGGTWDLFRYPGIRSDSDMFTLGYDFRPWDGAKSIADGESIRTYIEETAREHGVEERIRYHRRVERLSWDSGTGLWTAEVTDTGTGDTATLTARFVHSCTGYYRYDEGYLPDFEGMDDFAGELIHPQHWPDDFDGTGKHVVVIGSGATAMTLVPSLAGDVGHVTMLQRSPAYVTSLPDTDPLADLLRDTLPADTAHTLIKWKNVAISNGVYAASRRVPDLVRRFLLWRISRALPDDFDVDTHFTPDYDPWDQRLCLVPNNDLFTALRREQASIVTDTVDRFTETGIRLGSGRELQADVIVTATGLNLLMLGGMTLEVDGSPVDPADTVAYKGMMLSGVPNLAFTVGYTNASWTLKADLVSDYVCRLLEHMERTGHDQVWPTPPPAGAPTRPLIDLDAGYVRRSLDIMPRQGIRQPWTLHQSYRRDVRMFRGGALDDEGVEFRTTSSAARAPTG